jgi:hypothetical protein
MQQINFVVSKFISWREESLMFKNTGKMVVSVALSLLPLCLASNAVSAIGGTELTQPARQFLQETVLSNVGIVSVIAAVIVGIVAALGQQIGKFVLNNLGYIGYVAFGGTVATTAVTAAGLLI